MSRIKDLGDIIANSPTEAAQIQAQGRLTVDVRLRPKPRKLAAVLTDDQAKFLLSLIYHSDTDGIDTAQPSLVDVEEYEKRLDLYHAIAKALGPRISAEDFKQYQDAYSKMFERFIDIKKTHDEIFR